MGIERKGKSNRKQWGCFGLPRGDSGKNPPANAGDNLWVVKNAWKRAWQTHSNILAWRIPWTEKPGRLQSMPGHDWKKELDTSEVT